MRRVREAEDYEFLVTLAFAEIPLSSFLSPTHH